MKLFCSFVSKLKCKGFCRNDLLGLSEYKSAVRQFVLFLSLILAFCSYFRLTKSNYLAGELVGSFLAPLLRDALAVVGADRPVDLVVEVDHVAFCLVQDVGTPVQLVGHGSEMVRQGGARFAEEEEKYSS